MCCPARPADHPADPQPLLERYQGRQPSFTEIAFDLGVQRPTGHARAHGGSVSSQARAPSAALMRLLLKHRESAWATYRALIDRQARPERIDIRQTKSRAASEAADSDSLERTADDTTAPPGG